MLGVRVRISCRSLPTSLSFFSSDVHHGEPLTDLGALLCCNVYMCQVSCLFIYSKSDGDHEEPLPRSTGGSPSPSPRAPLTLFLGVSMLSESPCGP